MYKVYAQFGSREQSGSAADAVRRTFPDLSRVTVCPAPGTKRCSGGIRCGGRSDVLSDIFAGRMHTVGCMYAGATDDFAYRGYGAAGMIPEGGCIICAEGGCSAVREASRLLLTLGGENIRISSAPGRFL